MKTKNHLSKCSTSVTIFIALLLTVGMVSCKKDDSNGDKPPGKITYSGSFVKSKDNVTTSATGSTTATFDPTTRELAYTLTWSGLGSNAVNMHFHDAGPVIVGIEGFANAKSGTISGKATLTAEQAADLAAGKIYSQIHTETYPGGEVIATMKKVGSPSNPPGGGGGGGGGYDY